MPHADAIASEQREYCAGMSQENIELVRAGVSSGAKTEVSDGATAAKFSPRGLVTWQEWFVEQDGRLRALAAVGLRA
jgi:hypothetical protein